MGPADRPLRGHRAASLTFLGIRPNPKLLRDFRVDRFKRIDRLGQSCLLRAGMPPKRTTGRTGQKLGQMRHISSDDTSMMTESGFEMPSLRQAARVYFVGAQLREKLLGDSEAEGWLPVRIPLPGMHGRGRLGLILEEAIEKTLEARGACAPGIGACADSDASLSDQLYRARLLGAPGLALAIEQLKAIANQAGALDAEDSAVLRWWVMTARERPLRLYFDARDETLGVYTAPTHLGNLVRHAEEEDLRPSAPPPIDLQMVTSIQSMQPLSCIGSQEPVPMLDSESAEPSPQLLLPAELA